MANTRSSSRSGSRSSSRASTSRRSPSKNTTGNSSGGRSPNGRTKRGRNSTTSSRSETNSSSGYGSSRRSTEGGSASRNSSVSGRGRRLTEDHNQMEVDEGYENRGRGDRSQREYTGSEEDGMNPRGRRSNSGMRSSQSERGRSNNDDNGFRRSPGRGQGSNRGEYSDSDTDEFIQDQRSENRHGEDRMRGNSQQSFSRNGRGQSFGGRGGQDEENFNPPTSNRNANYDGDAPSRGRSTRAGRRFGPSNPYGTDTDQEMKNRGNHVRWSDYEDEDDGEDFASTDRTTSGRNFRSNSNGNPSRGVGNKGMRFPSDEEEWNDERGDSSTNRYELEHEEEYSANDSRSERSNATRDRSRSSSNPTQGRGRSGRGVPAGRSSRTANRSQSSRP